MSPFHKELRRLCEKLNSPPMGEQARVCAGHLLRLLQGGASIPMPDSRKMPSLGRRVAELRIEDGDVDWRIIYRVDKDCVLMISVFKKKGQKTPQKEIKLVKERLARYDSKQK